MDLLKKFLESCTADQCMGKILLQFVYSGELWCCIYELVIVVVVLFAKFFCVVNVTFSCINTCMTREKHFRLWSKLLTRRALTGGGQTKMRSVLLTYLSGTARGTSLLINDAVYSLG